MTTHESEAGDARALGLIADPFLVVDDGSADAAGINLSIRSAALGLLAAIDRTSVLTEHRPIVVELSPDVAPYYSVASLSVVMRALVDGVPTAGTIPAYIPLDMMRLGRVRALLSEMAERVAGKAPGAVLANWSVRALSQPDTSLPEWDALATSGFDIEAAIADAVNDPDGFSERIFGEKVISREGADDFETLMRISTSRQDRLETDPESDSADLAPSAEDSADDPFNSVFTTRLGELDDSALPEAEMGQLPELLVADYVVAYTKSNLSPVVARGIAAYRAQGIASMAEELKVTKAPTKTLLALYEFTGGVYDLGVVIYDRIEMWGSVPQDLRSKIVGTLTELRWNLKEHAVLVLLMAPGIAPELEEGFASADRVDWTFPNVEQLADFEAPYDVDTVSRWLDAAAIDGRPQWVEAALNAIPEGTTLELACRALSRAIGDAIAAGATQVEPASVVSALAAEKEAAPA